MAPCLVETSCRLNSMTRTSSKSESRKAYLREYQKNWVRKRRASYMSDKFCVICGSTKDLEVDHIDPSTKVSHRIWSWSWARIHEELKKCQVLCQEHHWEKSASQLKRKAQHGVITMYDRHKCRCELCRAVKSKANARRYKKKDA
jgi:5-methylcytosine-specific restriction endonuclease McrA